jgi:hypothetical protein
MKISIMVNVLVSAFFFFSGEALAWTTSADFEAGTEGQLAQGASGFAYAGSATTFSSDKTVNGTKSAKVIWPQGSNGWTIAHGELPLKSNVTNGQEIWMRGYYYFRSPWSWNTEVKIQRLGVMFQNGTHTGWISILAQGNTFVLSIETDESQAWEDARVPANFDIDVWQCVELYVNFSTSNPIVRIWKNGVLVKEERKYIVMRDPSSYIGRTMILSQWNDPQCPQTQTLYLDDFIITTDRPSQVDNKGNPMIGPGPFTGAPNPTSPSEPKGIRLIAP